MTADSGRLIARVRLEPAARPTSYRAPTKEACVDELTTTYRRAMARHADRYLELHSRPNSVRRQVDAFMLYQEYLPTAGRVLDWGCKHAPDACLMRFALGDEVELIGYDFDRGEAYADFYEAARLEFDEARHTYLMPYEDESFDVVLGSGVLEHVALPSNNLTELYRILKVGGVLVVTFLPNRWSWTEWALRRSGSNRFHRRRYTRRSAERLLLDHGFEPQVVGYHQFVPGQRGGRVTESLWRWNDALERLPPTRFLCANLYLIAVKRRAV